MSDAIGFSSSTPGTQVRICTCCRAATTARPPLETASKREATKYWRLGIAKCQVVEVRQLSRKEG